MGRIVRLELENFKSYRGHTRIDLGSAHFTLIIGPNGAGKSNMMDAILFVLGLQLSQLRSQNVRDLIYRGRRTGDETDGAAAAAAVLPLDGVDAGVIVTSDPHTASVTCIYQKDDGLHMALKRLITPAATTEYRIDDRAVTALQYLATLRRENILIKARNFLVFQGDVEQIAAQSARDLLQLVETISGSGELAAEYSRLAEERDGARTEANAVFARKRVLNAELRQYKEQMAEQDEFTRRLIEKHDLIKVKHLYRLYHNEQRHRGYQAQLEQAFARAQRAQEKALREEESLQALISTHAKLQLQVLAAQRQHQDLVHRIEQQRRDAVPIEAQKRSVSQQISTVRDKLKALGREKARQEAAMTQVQRQLGEAQRLYAEFLERAAPKGVSSRQRGQMAAEYERLRDEFLQAGGAQLEETLALWVEQRDTAALHIATLERQLANSGAKIDALRASVDDELEPKLAVVQAEISNVLTTRANREATRALMLEQREETKLRELELNTQLRDVLLKIDELSAHQRETQRQRKLRDNVGLLKRQLGARQIRGIVRDLVRPTQQKYDLALATLLGRHTDAVVVESTAVAYKCIEILKERRSGVATFIPLDMASHRASLGGRRGGVSLGLEVVAFDDASLEPAILHIVGDALVCDTIEAARQLKWGASEYGGKIVTLDGLVIHLSGLMTGGHQGARVVWDKATFKALNERKEALLQQLSDVNDSKPKELEFKQLLDEIELLEDQLPILRTKKSGLERVIEDRRKEIEFLRGGMAEVEAKVAAKRQEMAQIEAGVQHAQGDIGELQRVYADFCRKYALEGIQQYEDLHGSALRSRAKEKSQFVKAIATLNTKLAFEQERLHDLEQRLETLNAKLEEGEVLLVEELDKLELLQTSIDKLEAEAEVLASELAELTSVASEQLKQVRTLESAVEEALAEASLASKERVDLEESLLKVDAERLNVLKNCKIENVHIPLKEGNLEELSLDANAAYVVEIDYSMVSAKLKESWSAKAEAELEAKLESVVGILETLAPNAKAVERLELVEARLREFDRDFSRARQKENKITEKFNQIKQQRYDLFMGAFKHILDQIDPTYKELTRSAVTTLGGSAYLTLEDEDEPYLSGIKYHAMPPLKRFRDMDLLSGGEKTIAALALLFAVHSYQPSPFFVLDEVDAALDNSNVSKIANYIRAHAGPHFQFIVISLKNPLFEKSDSLVGIYRDQRENSSRTVTLDLREYLEAPIVA